jgi:hypothetical protein
MKRLHARMGILAVLLGTVGALTVMRVDATVQCGPPGCTWADAPDGDSDDGTYVPSMSTGGATWSCIVDGDVEQGCTLTVDHVESMSCQRGSVTNPVDGRWVDTLPREGTGDVCQWTQTGQVVSFIARGSTSGVIGDTPGRTVGLP